MRLSVLPEIASECLFAVGKTERIRVYGRRANLFGVRGRSATRANEEMAASVLRNVRCSPQGRVRPSPLDTGVPEGTTVRRGIPRYLGSAHTLASPCTLRASDRE